VSARVAIFAALVYDQEVRTELDEVGFFEGGGDRVELRLEQRQQRRVCHVAGSDNQEPLLGSFQSMAVSEVPILS